MEVRVVVPPPAAEAISSFFFDEGSTGITEEEGTDPERGAYVLLRAYFEASLKERRAEFEERLRAALLVAEAGKPRIWVDEIPYGDWAEGWKQYFKPRKLGRRLVVAPTWEEYTPSGDELVVRVDPGMAFGTGQHETTALCLQALEDVIERRPGARVLDVGTGSGILAIAAVLLGAASAHGTDNDPEATSAARENVEANALAGRVTIDERDLDALPADHDVVVANILAETLVALAPQLAPRVAAGGDLILSGILHHLAPKVVDAYRPLGFPSFEERRQGEWVVLLGRRN